MTTPSSLFSMALLPALTGCASLPTGVERPLSSHTGQDGEPSRIADYAAPLLRKHPGKSGFWLVGDGLDAYAARILLAETADRSIDVQYYLYHNDITGRILTYQLLRACRTAGLHDLGATSAGSRSSSEYNERLERA